MWYKIIGRNTNIVEHIIVIQNEKLFLNIGISDSVFVHENRALIFYLAWIAKCQLPLIMQTDKTKLLNKARNTILLLKYIYIWNPKRNKQLKNGTTSNLRKL